MKRVRDSSNELDVVPLTKRLKMFFVHSFNRVKSWIWTDKLNQDKFSEMPVEVFQIVSRFLDEGDMFNLSMVSKEMCFLSKQSWYLS
jgi:hypothetical protein